MAFCTECGQPIAEGAHFCTHCGTGRSGCPTPDAPPRPALHNVPPNAGPPPDEGAFAGQQAAAPAPLQSPLPPVQPPPKKSRAGLFAALAAVVLVALIALAAFSPSFGGQSGAGDPGPPVGTPLIGNWCGWIEYSGSRGADLFDQFLGAWGCIRKNSDGDWFLEIYADGEPERAVISMWLKDVEGKTALDPDIARGEAWVLDTGILEEEAGLFAKSVSPDGSLSFAYPYERYDGSASCDVRVFLRREGILWDEATDRLPPHYEAYKEEWSGRALG